jgi:hypothetical protein
MNREMRLIPMRSLSFMAWASGSFLGFLRNPHAMPGKAEYARILREILACPGKFFSNRQDRRGRKFHVQVGVKKPLEGLREVQPVEGEPMKKAPGRNSRRPSRRRTGGCRRAYFTLCL